MFFLDSLGFFSLTCLLIQCGLAWIFLAVFALLAPSDAVWVRSWRTAFSGLAVALLAVSVRFALAHHHITWSHRIEEGSFEARLSYGLYLAGKVVFVWFLVAGVAALRDRPWPRSGWIPALAIAAGGAIGAIVPTVESLLLVKAPMVVAGFGYAWRCLRRRADEPREAGRRLARVVFAGWAVAWASYGLAALAVGPVHPDADSPWMLLLRVNSLVDLVMQVALGCALIVVVMHDTQAASLAALHERDRLRDRVRRDEKLRMTSTLVGGIAHELNNPLTAILGFAQMLASDDADSRKKAARVVTEQAERCRNIVKRMSLLGHRPDLAIGTIDTTALLERVAHGFQPQLVQAGVVLEISIDEAPCELQGDASGIEQVMTNLIANAVQASPRGGTVRVATVVAPDALHVRVDDEGPGVPFADRARIFEPFWTSKKAGEGTGLGLAVAQVLVQAHGGRIVVSDSPRGGARFEVILPWVPEPASDRTAAPARAGLQLLVVDDEALVRATIARQAERYGWTVVPAESGQRALELLLAEGASFDAVVCDLRMAGMSGAGLHDELVRRAPWLLRRLLFVSGDLSSAEAAEFALRCNAPILAKPFGVADLFGRLREVVGGA